jgi:hypothetical protein
VGELIGYARCSTVLQDITARREILTGRGVPDVRIYLDKGLTGTSRAELRRLPPFSQSDRLRHGRLHGYLDNYAGNR